MTAARSDLMALKNEADRIVKCGVTDFPVYQAIELLEEVSGTIDHLAAASQPDREAVKEFIASASFASRSSLDSDTIFCEIYTPGYQPAKKGSFGFFVKELRAILSLLSGAGTPAPAVGADVGRRVLDILNAVAPAVENLAGHQEQCDIDGAMVKVSRQALDEVLNAVNEVALLYETAHDGDLAHYADVLRDWLWDNKERIAALSAPVGEPVAWQFMASDDVVLSTTADKRVVKQWEQSGYHVRPLYTYPPAPAVGAEDVARLIDPMAFKSWHGLYDYCIRDGDDDAFARRCADSTHKADCDAALAKADAILSLLSGQGERKSKS